MSAIAYHPTNDRHLLAVALVWLALLAVGVTAGIALSMATHKSAPVPAGPSPTVSARPR